VTKQQAIFAATSAPALSPTLDAATATTGTSTTPTLSSIAGILHVSGPSSGTAGIGSLGPAGSTTLSPSSSTLSPSTSTLSPSSSTTCTATTTTVTHDVGAASGSRNADGQVTADAISVEDNCGSGFSGTAAFGYDRAGQVTSVDQASAATTDVSYDPAGQMTTSTTSSGTTTYAYGEGGLLAAETAPGAAAPRQLTWDGTQSLPLLIPDSTDDFLYGQTSTPVEQVNVTSSPPASNPTFVNYPGVVGQDFTATTTTSGQPTNTTTDGPFGTEDGTSGTPFGYAGQYAGGPGTPPGFTNMRARWYVAGTGTFTTVDPALATTDQPDEYAGNDPVNQSDPSGLSWWNPCRWGNVCHHVANTIGGAGRSIAGLPCGLGSNPSTVVGRCAAAPYGNFLGPTTLYCGTDNTSGFTHLEAHYYQSGMPWDKFSLAISFTLGHPNNIQYQGSNNTLKYIGPVAWVDSNTGQIQQRFAFYVIVGLPRGAIVTAWASTKPKNLRQAGWTGDLSSDSIGDCGSLSSAIYQA